MLMGVDGSAAALIVATFVASAVEFVEAFTIVLAMGLSREWRSTLLGAASAVITLAALTAITGIALVAYLPESLIQLLVGSLLLVFGLQWLRKAILRTAGLKALHDEEAAFRAEQDAARRAGPRQRLGLDWFAFVVSFKGVFLEGLEVVFIVVTFGLNADAVPLAAASAGVAFLVVLIAGLAARRPLSRVPENTLKFTVGILLTTFGTYWAVEGLGVFTEAGESLHWPGGDWALPALLALWLTLAYGAVNALRPRPAAERTS
jgi:Ca2+/H+ antiporter, TMEM165/GDT1 family